MSTTISTETTDSATWNDSTAVAPPLGDITSKPADSTPENTSQQAASQPKPDRWSRGLDWPVVIWIGVLHLAAIPAFFLFTWQGFFSFLFLYWLTGGVGICLGYHRQLTHMSFQTYRPIRWLLAFLGGLAGEGSAARWVANHRKHHAFSDQEEDPHSPRHGGLWSHMLWFCPFQSREEEKILIGKYAPDMARDPVIAFLHKTFLLWPWLVGLTLLAIGWSVWDVYTGVSMMAWGLFFRMVFVFHITWFVNSATHMWGYRNYQTEDDSTNLWWVGLLAFGEGWHNNHHAYQRLAAHGHRWWEIDLTYGMICVMEKLGLAWNVVREKPKHARGLLLTGDTATSKSV